MDKHNIVSFGKKTENLRKSLESLTIGSTLSTFQENLSNNPTIFLHCNAMIWGTAAVASNYFYSEEKIWEDKTYPHRFKISNVKMLNEPIPLCDGKINKAFRDQFGSGWAYKFIFSPKPLPVDITRLILCSINNED